MYITIYTYLLRFKVANVLLAKMTTCRINVWVGNEKVRKSKVTFLYRI